MRFTRIPLIATLLAGALSLLVVLPAIAQSTLGVQTDGRLSAAGAFEVQVYSNIADIRTRGIAAATTTFAPAAANPDGETGRTVEGASTTTVARGDQAMGLSDTVDDVNLDYGRVPDPRNTFFNENLYVSNDKDAFNTILITARVPDGDNVTRNDNTDANDALPDGWASTVSGASYDCATAVAKNARSGESADVILFRAGDRIAGTNEDVYQGILAIRDRGEESGRVQKRNSVCMDAPLAEPVINPDESATDPWTVPSALRGISKPPQAAAVVPARDGDTIEITVTGVQGRIVLTVDGDAPTVTNLLPEDGGTTSSARVTLGFTVSDDGAGLRFDSEDGASGDGDSSPANGDQDQRYNEPLTIADGDSNTAGWQAPTGATSNIQGATEDIQVYYSADEAGITDGTPDVDQPDSQHTLGVQPATVAEEFSGYGSNGWTQVAFGRSYRLSMILNSQAFGDYEWMVVVRDRVGNMYTTDGDDDESGPQPFTFSLDNEDPMIQEVRTGVRFDSAASPAREKADRSWIALTIVNEESTDMEDLVDRSTVSASDFTVSGSTVINAVVPTTKRVCKEDVQSTDANEAAGNVYDIDGKAYPANCTDFYPRARIYLQLAEPLDADETPTIQVLGGVFTDLAGNSNVVQQVRGNAVVDKIAPGVSITVTASGEATNRPATDEDGEFTIRVTSDEDLARFPLIWIATIRDTGDTATADADADVAADLYVHEHARYRPTELERNVWERKIKADDSNLPGGSDPRLLAVLVNAEDEAGNKGNSDGWSGASTEGAPLIGTTGTSPNIAPNTTLDFKKLDDGGYLIEIDPNNLSAPTVEIKPDKGAKATESLTPYLEITFTGERNEYGISDGTRTTPYYKADAGEDDDPIKTDSHEAIELTKLEVDGEDRLSDVRSVDANKGQFILAFIEGLSLGKHTVVYAAKDDVGNQLAANSAGDREGTYTFEVKARAGYEVDLRPGWNLISLPGTPTNPSVDATLNNLRANTVLSYQNGEWLSAIRGDDDEWQGTLEQIVGGYGYWVQTTSAETIKTVIPPTLPNQVLPTVPITSGWNLVGVIDPEQRAEGTASDPDRYFVNVSWRVAYGFNTQGSRWEKILPAPSTDDGANDDKIKNGAGYWLWSTEPGTLVP